MNHSLALYLFLCALFIAVAFFMVLGYRLRCKVLEARLVDREHLIFILQEEIDIKRELTRDLTHNHAELIMLTEKNNSRFPKATGETVEARFQAPGNTTDV